MALMNNQKKTCYVGGLADEVDESVIRAAFIPFGDISEVSQYVHISRRALNSFALYYFLKPDIVKSMPMK